VSRLILVVQHLSQSLVLDILLGVLKSDMLPLCACTLLVLPTLSLLILIVSLLPVSA
jgi:hypothetical protein